MSSREGKGERGKGEKKGTREGGHEGEQEGGENDWNK